jgi:sulfoxide reductase heme-binding subunit YedZ
VHQIVSVMGLTLAAVHAFAQLAVPFGAVHLVDVVVPFTSPTDPLGLGAAVISLETMTAAALSVLIQRWMGYNRWRALHALNHVAFLLLVAHILISGSDVTSAPVWGTVLGAWLFTVLLWLSTAVRSSRISRYVTDRISVGRPQGKVTVGVDSAQCARFGFCEHEAPDVFTLLSDGRLSYRVSIAADQVNDVVRAAEVCPRRAISLSRTPTAIVSGQRPEAAAHETSPRGLRAVNLDEQRTRRVKS